jgi:hypothetical protein
MTSENRLQLVHQWEGPLLLIAYAHEQSVLLLGSRLDW